MGVWAMRVGGMGVGVRPAEMISSSSVTGSGSGLTGCCNGWKGRDPLGDIFLNVFFNYFF